MYPIHHHILSEENSYGIFDINWLDGDEFSITIEPKKKLQTSIIFKVLQHENLKITSNCSLEEPYYKCASKRLVSKLNRLYFNSIIILFYTFLQSSKDFPQK